MWTQILLSSCACFLRPQLCTNLKKDLINRWRMQETPPLLYDLSNSLIEDLDININLEDKQNIPPFLLFIFFFYSITLNITLIYNLHLKLFSYQFHLPIDQERWSCILEGRHYLMLHSCNTVCCLWLLMISCDFYQLAEISHPFSAGLPSAGLECITWAHAASTLSTCKSHTQITDTYILDAATF